MKSALIMSEEMNKKLKADNQEYVKQIISMKESRAQLMNDCLSGKLSAEMGESIRTNLNAEESKFSETIKPEYLRPASEPTSLPGHVTWRTCGH